MCCMLKSPVETQICTPFYTLNPLLQNKAIVMDTFSCIIFHDWEDGERERVKEKTSELLKVLNIRRGRVECIESMDFKDLKRPF